MGAVISQDRDDARRLRELLDEANFSERGICELMEVDRVRALDKVPAEVVLSRLDEETPLHLLVRLFLLGLDIPVDPARTALAPIGIEALSEIGLINPGLKPRSVGAELRIVPHEAMLFASDWPARPGKPMAADHVLGVNPTALLLANMAIRRPVGSLLDLGTGCGVQSILAEGVADQMVASDINGRAVEIAKFNSHLNGVEIECLEGDLFESVAGRRFDQVLSNPPFVISPESRYMYRDSGHGGEGISRKIISTVQEVLADRGLCQFLCNWAEVEGEDFEERLEAAFEGCGCDAWVISIERIDAALYAQGWMNQSEIDDPDDFDRLFKEWMDFFEKSRIEAVRWCVVTMRRTSGRPNWFELSELDGELGDEPAGEHLLRCFEARELIAATDDSGMLDLRMRAAPEVRLQQRFEPGPEGWSATEGYLSYLDGLPFIGAVDAQVANLLIRCDGDRTLRDVLQQSADDAGVSLEALGAEGLNLIRKLARNGFLIPA